MARDYARPRNPNAGRSGKRSNGGSSNRGSGGGSGGAPLPGWVWMLGGLALGLVIAAFVYIDRPQHQTRLGEAAAVDGREASGLVGDGKSRRAADAPANAKPKADGTTKSASASTAKPKAAAAPSVPPAPEDVPPKYTFYNELPKIEVAIPREYSRAPAPGKPAAPPPAEVEQALKTPGRYLIQVGAYKTREDADRQKAKLALIGYESRIEPVTLGERDVRYRVRIGPEPTQLAAKAVQSRLESNGISGFLVKIPD